MNLAITLSADDIDAMATGLGEAFAAVPFDELVRRIAFAAETQPGAPQAQLALRLIAESLRTECAADGDEDKCA